MDKHHQHDPPQGIPPPDAETQQHLEEVADFSNIKDGFEEAMAGLSPPKFQWDTIEQELQAEVVTDEPTAFSSIKQGFENSFMTQSAPSFPWESLDQPETPAQEASSEDYSTIKKSFEGQYSSIVVPLFTWEELQVRMEEDAAQINNAHEQYSNVNKSFVSVYGTQQPSTEIWTAIFKHLHPRAAWWEANRARIGSAAAMLVLLAALGVAWTLQSPSAPLALDPSQVQRGKKQASEYASVPNNDASATSSPTAATSRVRSIGELLSYNTPFFPYATQPLAWSPIPSNDPSTPPTETQLLASLAKPNSGMETTSAYRTPTSAVKPTTALSAEATAPATTEALRRQSVAGSSDATPSIKGAFTSGITLEKEEKTAVQASGTTKALEKEVLDLVQAPANGTAPIVDNPFDGIAQIGANTKATEAAALEEALELGLAIETFQIYDPSIRAMEEASFPIVRKPLTGKRLRIEVGAIGRFGTSLLLRPKSRRSMESERTFGPSTAVGLTGQLYFGKNDALVVSGYPFIMTGHGLREEVPNRRPRQTDVELCFMEVTMGYQRVLWRYSMLGEAPSRFYTRLDLGVGWLTKSNTQLNHRPRHQATWYNRLQYSAGLSFGTTHELGNIVLDYGLTGTTGLNSLVSPEHPSLAQPTRLFQGGVYVSMRYLIQPRLAPSKRMRQFDWSPPFYIEEPSY